MKRTAKITATAIITTCRGTAGRRPTDDAQINAARAQQKRNLLATLLLSIGTPMLLMGDELSRTQGGNNNAYAQDNEISWMDWTAGAERDPALLEFVRTLVRLRRDYASFRRTTYLRGVELPATGLKDVYWLAPEGCEMSPEHWTQDLRRTFGMQIGNEGGGERRFLILLNAAPKTSTSNCLTISPRGPSCMSSIRACRTDS